MRVLYGHHVAQAVDPEMTSSLINFYKPWLVLISTKPTQ